jgi:hypothetical protein
MAAFHLDKWFFDVTADSGEAAVVYCAKLTWGLLHVTWASVLQVSQALRVQSSFALTGITPPVVDGDAMTWSHSQLRVAAECRFLHRADSVTLLDLPEGFVKWHCISPLADVRMTAAGHEIVGRGYVERLQMTLRPGRLPIDTLHWGHFVSQDHSRVWICWEGPRPLRLGLQDGRPGDVDPADLKLQRIATLRAGPVARTVLYSIPGLSHLLPGRIGRMTESKWLSRGRLAGQSGWAIHEKVEFGKELA